MLFLWCGRNCIARETLESGKVPTACIIHGAVAHFTSFDTTIKHYLKVKLRMPLWPHFHVIFRIEALQWFCFCYRISCHLNGGKENVIVKCWMFSGCSGEKFPLEFQLAILAERHPQVKKPLYHISFLYKDPAKNWSELTEVPPLQSNQMCCPTCRTHFFPSGLLLSQMWYSCRPLHYVDSANLAARSEVKL